MATKAQAERERLEAELKTIRRNKADANRAAVSARKDVERLVKERRFLLAAAARNEKGADERIIANTAETERAEAAVREADERHEAARSAERVTEGRLRSHLMDNLAFFIKGADKLTDTALADRQRVLEAIEQARASEAEARAEWVVLKNAARSQHVDLGQMPPEWFSAGDVTRIRELPRPEPRNVARSRKRRLGIPNLPRAIRDLFKGSEPEGD
jgi:hypothetical protein